jgi:hypothetical protein
MMGGLQQQEQQQLCSCPPSLECTIRNATIIIGVKMEVRNGIEQADLPFGATNNAIRVMRKDGGSAADLLVATMTRRRTEKVVVKRLLARREQKQVVSHSGVCLDGKKECTRVLRVYIFSSL